MAIIFESSLIGIKVSPGICLNSVKELKLLYFPRNVVLRCSLYLTPDMVIQVCLFYVHFDNNTLMLVIFLKLVIVICQVCFAWFFSRLISTNSCLV